MNLEPRGRADYSERQTAAAHRVLVDIGQVLASYADCLVVVGGWTPDLLLPNAEEAHIGSNDVDIALDAAKLNNGRYAELIESLLNTRRYRMGEKDFQLVAEVDLQDGENLVQVEVEFLAPKDVKFKRNKPKLLPKFRVLQVSAASEAFRSPIACKLDGQNIRGATNKIELRVVSLTDFLVMKAHAIGGRDKPKDTYDLCYCLEHGDLEKLAEDWKSRSEEKNVARAIEILLEKFEDVNAFGPQQMVEFHSASDKETQAMHARRAFELVQKFLSLV